jgi:Tol biopolymer transport system component
LLVLVLAACGRVRFDPLPGSGDAVSNDSSRDGSGVLCSAWSTPQPITAVNSSSEDYDPELSPDGRWLVFASERADPQDDLYLSQVTGGAYGAPQPVAIVNSIGGYDNNPTWDPSGGILYFVAGSNQLYTSTFAAGALGTPVLVPELQSVAMVGPAMAASGTELFYTVAAMGTVKMWRTTRATPTSPWGTPAPVPELAAYNAGWPTLSADGKTMYFEGDAGGFTQLYVVTRPAVGAAFGTPAVFTDVADNSANEGDPFVSYDGQTFMFSSERGGPSTGSDLYVSTRTCQ